MSKYIIEIEDEPNYDIDGEEYYQSVQAPWWYLSKNIIERLEPFEPKQGEWIMHIDDIWPSESTQECSVCHEHQIIGNDDNYCPNCGARMKGASDE